MGLRSCLVSFGLLGLFAACGSAEFKDSEDGEGESGAPGNGGSASGGGNTGGSGAGGAGGEDVGGEGSGGAAGSGGRDSGGSTATGGSDSGGSDATGGTGGDETGGAGSGNGGNPSGGAGSGNGGDPTGGAGSGNGGNPTGGAGSGGSAGSGGGPTYVDVQLISSCSGPRGEVYDGAWYAGVGGASTLSPAHSEGAFPVTSSGYVGSAVRVWGTMAQADYAHVGHNMYRGAALFNASAYAGVSFFAKAAAPISVRVGLGQQNNDPGYGVCTPDVTCYKYPEVTISVGTSWTRYVALFSEMQTSPPGLVATTPGTLKHIQFSMEPGAYDFYVDELYFVAPE